MTFGVITRTCWKPEAGRQHRGPEHLRSPLPVYQSAEAAGYERGSAIPEQRLRLPVILSPDEVAQLIGAAAICTTARS